MPIDPALVGVAVLTAAEAPNFLAGMMPSLFTISAALGAGRSESRKPLMLGMALGNGLALAVAIGAGMATDSVGPVWATLAVLAALDASYLWAMRHPLAPGAFGVADTVGSG